jgi:DNA-binding CsgD family transcriptional regulator
MHRSAAPEEPCGVVPLTRREREILAWVAQGKTNGEIGAILWIAPSTVRKHLEHIYPKLGVRTRAGAVGRFLRGSSAGGEG